MLIVNHIIYTRQFSHEIHCVSYHSRDIVFVKKDSYDVIIAKLYIRVNNCIISGMDDYIQHWQTVCNEILNNTFDADHFAARLNHEKQNSRPDKPEMRYYTPNAVALLENHCNWQ